MHRLGAVPAVFMFRLGGLALSAQVLWKAPETVSSFSAKTQVPDCSKVSMNHFQLFGLQLKSERLFSFSSWPAGAEGCHKGGNTDP